MIYLYRNTFASIVQPVFSMSRDHDEMKEQKGLKDFNNLGSGVVEENENLYEVEAAPQYNPVQPLSQDHNISMFPIKKKDHHILQVCKIMINSPRYICSE